MPDMAGVYQIKRASVAGGIRWTPQHLSCFVSHPTQAFQEVINTCVTAVLSRSGGTCMRIVGNELVPSFRSSCQPRLLLPTTTRPAAVGLQLCPGRMPRTCL